MDQTAPNTFTLTGASAGTYSTVVQDQISGCQTVQAIGVSDAVYTATITAKPPNCDPVFLHIVTTGAAVPVAYTTTNSATGTKTTGSSATAAFDLATGLPQGTYVIELKDNAGCILTKNQTITPAPKLPVKITPDLCTMTLTGSGATSYTWSSSPLNAITGPLNQPTAQLTPTSGSLVTFKVTGTGAGCAGIDSLTLNVFNIPKPLLSQTTQCDVNATINVTPVGVFNYRWFVNE
ncbi:MAG: hypothetical protein WDO15_08065 [Bacteroidota bacterium]